MVSDAKFRNQVERAAEAEDADAVCAPRLEPPRVRQQVDLREKLKRLPHAEPADGAHRETLQRPVRAIEDADALRPHQPLVGIGGQHIDAAPLYVAPQRAEALDAVHDEEEVVLAAEITNRGEVGAEAGLELHRADRDGARPPVNRGTEVIEQDAPLARLDQTGLHPLSGEIEPWIDDRREIARRDDGVIARAPVDAVRRERQPLRGVFDEGDLVRPGIDQCRTPRADLLLAVGPARPIQREIFFSGCRHRLLRPPGDRADCRVIEIDDMLSNRKFRAYPVNIDHHAPPPALDSRQHSRQGRS